VAFAYDTYTNPSKNNGLLRAMLTFRSGCLPKSMPWVSGDGEALGQESLEVGAQVFVFDSLEE
jgi:hypothetical protein